MFEYACMAQLLTVRELQQRISQMQPLRPGDGGLPVPPELRPLLPGGALRPGSTTVVRGSLQLALALISAASASGAWCGVIGLPRLGLEAVGKLGIALDRLILVPDPGSHSMSVAGTLGEVLKIVLLQPKGRTSPGEIERLNARLRDHGSALIALDAWPRAECTLRVIASHWEGLGHGHGLLETRELSVRTEDRRGPGQHTVRFRDGRLVAAGSTADEPSRETRLELVPS